ncbi:hypothetical protein GLAREA_12058 [Glarea lozoyensis ATCC 20868]|uniref:Translocation protein sec66 n=2 Tax=Glarea lozoyensis TaxID=101852 RepID=S3DIW5_GLAL2|nr:uncharacterized protein GLAREA_12058 [Glarea lozoyensis ATCC 20868]EHK97558.1 putative Translocation protein sec66 [Glarea lozoyensis 74030]EPE31976.1 hypothetical protein GLAREA_12058 [Glarea lozoyensis ATCC 20868]
MSKSNLEEIYQSFCDTFASPYTPWVTLALAIGSHQAILRYQSYREDQKAAAVPWFPRNIQRDIYNSIASKMKNKLPKSIQHAALLRYAVETVRRGREILQLRDPSGRFEVLVPSPSHIRTRRIERAFVELQEDEKVIKREARKLSKGWGKTIFASAVAILENEELTKSLDEIEGKREREIGMWEIKKQDILKDFLVEIEEEQERAKIAAMKKQSRADKSGKKGKK